MSEKHWMKYTLTSSMAFNTFSYYIRKMRKYGLEVGWVESLLDHWDQEVALSSSTLTWQKPEYYKHTCKVGLILFNTFISDLDYDKALKANLQKALVYKC